MNLQEIATRLLLAQQSAKPIRQFTDEFPSFSVEDAYKVQSIGLQYALEKGEKLAGYKMGLTSYAKQRDVQVFEAIHGYVLKSMEVAKGGALDTTQRIHPRVEPEVAVVLKSNLQGPGITLRDVENALQGVYPAIEIVDSRYEAFKFKLADVVADNTSASAFMVGRDNYINRLADLTLTGILVKKNGEIVETGTPAAAFGDPLLSVVSLINSLAKSEQALEAGMVVLTGGLTNSVPFTKGDCIEVLWPNETLSFQAI